MKKLKLVISLFAVLILGGFTYFAITDIPVERSEVTKTIPNERFFGNGS